MDGRMLFGRECLALKSDSMDGSKVNTDQDFAAVRRSYREWKWRKEIEDMENRMDRIFGPYRRENNSLLVHQRPDRPKKMQIYSLCGRSPLSFTKWEVGYKRRGAGNGEVHDFYHGRHEARLAARGAAERPRQCPVLREPPPGEPEGQLVQIRPPDEREGELGAGDQSRNVLQPFADEPLGQTEDQPTTNEPREVPEVRECLDSVGRFCQDRSIMAILHARFFLQRFKAKIITH